MTFQILNIAVYSKKGELRVLDFIPDKLNIITGDSKTGKSALISIVDYCLGASSCSVPDGIIRDTASWFALKLLVSESHVVICRKCPLHGKQTSDEIYIEFGSSVSLPEYKDLHQNSNKEGLLYELNGALGISENLHEPPENQTRRSVSASIRHGLMMCFQPQDEIIRKDQLFHGASDNYKAQGLKDTLPYFLGAVDEDYVKIKNRITSLKKELRLIERRLSDILSISGGGNSKAEALLTEARSTGLWNDDFLHLDSIYEQLEEITKIEVNTTTESYVENDEVDRLKEEQNSLSSKLRDINNRISAVKSLESAEYGFQKEAIEHRSRLKSINLFDQIDTHACPVCESKLGDQQNLPSQRDFISALEQIDKKLGKVSRNSPHISEAIAGLESEKQELNEQLRQNHQNINALKELNSNFHNRRYEASLKERVIGRISLFVESLPSKVGADDLEAKANVLREEIAELEDRLSVENVQERVQSINSILSKDMSLWAQKLELEFSGSPLRFDFNKLTIVTDTISGPIPLKRMGSGENWVGYHLIGHIALHHWLSSNSRPTPNFIFFDQPSQVYFPPDSRTKGIMDIDSLEVDDRENLRRMFRFIYDAVESCESGMQVIITEHADLQTEWFQGSISERWRGGVKLIPMDWLNSN